MERVLHAKFAYLTALTSLKPPFFYFLVLFNPRISFAGIYCRPLFGSA